MSEITRLNITSIRNIQTVTIAPCPRINLFWGENGSGKTSILESIHLLATGRSFRSVRPQTLISEDSSEAIVYVELADGGRIGLSRRRRQPIKLKFQDQRQKNWENVARAIPVLVLDSNSFRLLESGPKVRRRFLDWGVFHVEPSFLAHWRTVNKCVANRNSLLRQSRLDKSQLEAWDTELIHAAIAVDMARTAYFTRLLPVFQNVYSTLGGEAIKKLTMRYDPGWDSALDFASVLSSGLEADLRYGATQNGPHRADIKVQIDKTPAVEFLSRGQQKILVSSLKIAQARILADATGRQSIYLVDDLPSELDKGNRLAVLKMLTQLGGQLFVTSIDLDAITIDVDQIEKAVFHVERGTITT